MDDLIAILKPEYPNIAWCVRKGRISWKTMDLEMIKKGRHSFMIFDLAVLKRDTLARVAFVDNGERIQAYWTTIAWQQWDKQATAGNAAKKIELDICNDSIEDLEQFLKTKLNG